MSEQPISEMSAAMSPNALLAFNEERAAVYDSQFARMAPFRDALHVLLGGLLGGLPAEARILCVGAGTGAEMISLAQLFPGWRFTAVDPSAAMLEVARRKVVSHGLESRCEFHAGYLDSLPPTEPFDAATSILVSHFILDREVRSKFFRGIAERLRPGGYLATADLASDTQSDAYRNLLEVWLRLMSGMDLPPEQIENMRTVYSRDVSLLPLHELSGLIASSGFETPTLFLQTCLIHGWFTKRVSIR